MLNLVSYILLNKLYMSMYNIFTTMINKREFLKNLLTLL